MTDITAELVNHDNDDLTVVNAARVSFDKQSDSVEEGDVKLIKYLANHNHWTPFSHCRFTFIGADESILNHIPLSSELRTGLIFDDSRLQKVRHSLFGWVQMLQAGIVNREYENSIVNQLIKAMPVAMAAYGFEKFRQIHALTAITYPQNEEHDPAFIDVTVRETVPIFLARQRFKHTVDFDYNEVSRRYVSDTPDFFFPDVWRGAPTNGAKQGSSDAEIKTMWMMDYGENFETDVGTQYSAFLSSCDMLYQSMLKAGIAPEQARMVLPQSMFTSYYVTGSLLAWSRAYGLRIDGHAQKEIRDLAVQWGDIMHDVRPDVWAGLV